MSIYPDAPVATAVAHAAAAGRVGMSTRPDPERSGAVENSHPEMPSSQASLGLVRTHPLTKPPSMPPSRRTRSSYGPPYPLGRWSLEESTYPRFLGPTQLISHTTYLFYGFVKGLNGAFVEYLPNFIVIIVFLGLGRERFLPLARYTHRSLLRISPTLLPPLSLLQHRPGS